MAQVPAAQAVMGYYGFVTFRSLPAIGDISVRSTNIGLQMTQNISKPPLVDGRFDYTAYQLEAREVGGSISFPAVHGGTCQNPEGSAAAMRGLWKAALERDAGSGRLLSQFPIDVKYANAVGHNGQGGGTSDVAFRYTGCVADSFEMSVQQGGTIDVNMNIVGIDRQPGSVEEARYPTRNTRIMTWNDVRLCLSNGRGSTIGSSTNLGPQPGQVEGDVIRSFSVNVANNVERFYTLNGRLTPQDVTATKRDISGQVTALGRIYNIAEWARTNETRCSEDSGIVFGVTPCVDSGATSTQTDPFAIVLPGVVYQIEEMSLTTDIYETTFTYHVLAGEASTPDCGPHAGLVDPSFLLSSFNPEKPCDSLPTV